MGIYIPIAIFIICLGNIPKIEAIDEIIDCSNEELVTSVFNEPIDLSLNGTIKIYENVVINGILSTSNNEFEVKYIDARLDNTTSSNTTTIAGNGTQNLIIFTTEHFQNYAKEQTSARISLKINLDCGSGKERILVFFQPFKEGNYYSPLFSQSQYVLFMPTPIFSGFELTTLLEISAKDDDLTHNQINFTSTSSSQYHISVGTKNVTSADKKTYFANVTLERIYLELPQQIEFVITATDNGEPPRSSNATVIVRSDPLKRLPIKPRFTQQLYKGSIGLDFSMKPIRLELTNGSYSPEVAYSLFGNQTEGFEFVDNKDGSVQIEWNADLFDPAFIIQHKKWELQLKAEHSQIAEFSVATIVVELVDLQAFFHFMSTYYDGRIDEQGNLELMPIIFYPVMYKQDMTFSLLENPQNMFSVSNMMFQVHIRTQPNFTLDAFGSDAYIKLTLKASWKELAAITYIVLELPKKPENTSSNNVEQQMFKFQKPLYSGNLTADHKLELEIIRLQTDGTHANANTTSHLREFNISGEASHLFRLLIVNDSQVQLQLKATEIDKDIQFKSPIILLLEAKEGNRSAHATIVIQKPATTSANVTTVFISHSLVGKLRLVNDTQILAMDAIDLKPLENLGNYDFSLEGDVAENFELKQNLSSQQLDVVLKHPILEMILEERSILMLNVNAKLKGSSSSVADVLMIFIELPKKECPAPIKPELNPPSFSSTNYVFTTFTNTTGSLGAVRAYSESNNAMFHYMLEVGNETLAQRLSIEPFSGELMLYGSLEVGNYLFNVSAENLETHEWARTQAVLKVSEKEQCKIYEGVTVEKTLVIKHVDEERRYYGLWDMRFNENCTFYIADIWPKEKEYLYVNESTNKLDLLAVDREDAMFRNMSDAQIIVQLKLICGAQPNPNPLPLNHTRSARTLEPLEHIYSQDISYSPDTMWLHLLIDDINDNAPQFKYKYSRDYLGYPASKVPLDVYPEYLIKIEATDLDLNLNGKIRYSMRNNLYFDIEPETGIIYPKGMLLQPQQQTELIILATDQDGQGLVSGTVIVVKGLSPDFCTLITLRGNSSKSLSEISKELREKTGYAVRIIKMSYVPQMQMRADTDGLICKAWIYAYRDQQLVETKELQEKILVKSPEASIVNVESYDEAAQQFSAPPKSSSNLGYIIAVSILSLVSGLSIAFIIWQYYYNGQQMPFFNCNTKATSSDHHRSNNGGGGCHAQECSHGRDNGSECTACSNNYSATAPSHHVKFSNLVDNDNT
ncbi:uncharacterized protein LOC101889132 [Musca domestica]|uniref:Uncharacterized protein LOC101889132 n=2 Tax=Musca domestica TaxID=7370 RepID=A0ABM3UN11_MUSDO|nr:uncharacterized protein LOC101889132 [Musca domestica]